MKSGHESASACAATASTRMTAVPALRSSLHVQCGLATLCLAMLARSALFRRLQGAMYANTVDGEGSGNTWNASVQLNYRLKNGMSFQAGSQYLKNNSSATTTLPSFTEIRLKAGFTWSITKSVKQKNKA